MDLTVRNVHCTSIFIEDVSKIQIIHRAYKTPSEVVTGFDLMCCKAFFDGEDVYLTVDAAICIYFGINPVDWRRESPSHMQRILKYYSKYDLVSYFSWLDI